MRSISIIFYLFYSFISTSKLLTPDSKLSKNDSEAISALRSPIAFKVFVKRIICPTSSDAALY